MKILLTGGAGFIGSQVADRYLQEGHEVVILDNLSLGHKMNVPPDARFYQEDLLSPKLRKILEKERPEVVNHHAAQIDLRKSIEDPVRDAQNNILGSISLLEASRQSGVKKLIYASSGGAIYGRQDRFPADESHREIPENPYGISKLTVERYIQYYHARHGLPYVILRYANIYGPRQGLKGEGGVIAVFIQRILRGEPPVIYGSGTQTRDFVFVEDVVACNVEALKRDRPGVFNVGTGIETDVGSLAHRLIALLGVQMEPGYAPERKGEVLRSCLTPGALQKGDPTPVERGLKKTADWFLRNQIRP